MKQRLVWLDALKGIGILSIMRIHMIAPMELLQSIIYVGAVSMFFVCAGFNFHTSGNARNLLISKAKRLLIPYFFYSIILIILEHRIDFSTISQVFGILYARMSIYRGSAEGYLLIGNAPMWFLPCMFVSYIWLIMIYSKCKTNIHKIIVATSFFFISAILSYCPIIFPWSLDTSFLLTTLIILGYELRERFLHTTKWLTCIATVSWLILYYFFVGSNISIGYYGEYGIISIIAFMLIAIAETYSLSGILQMTDNTWITKALSYIGQQSLRLMCIHLIIYIRLTDFLSANAQSIYTNKWLLLCISFSFILIINAIMDVIIKKLQNRINWVKYI